MDLGHVVVREIGHWITLCLERGNQVVFFRDTVTQLDPGEHLGVAQVGVPIVEFGDRSRPERVAKRPKAPRVFGNGDPEERLALFAELRELGDMPQPIEVDVSPR